MSYSSFTLIFYCMTLGWLDWLVGHCRGFIISLRYYSVTYYFKALRNNSMTYYDSLCGGQNFGSSVQ